MVRFDGFSVEELAAAMLREEGWRVDIADPVTNHEWEDGERKVVPKRDFFGEFDLLCLHPQLGVYLIQVTRDDQDAVSDKMTSIALSSPWPSVTVEVWHWDGKRFATWRRVDGEWKEWTVHTPREDPQTLIDRHDKSLG